MNCDPVFFDRRDGSHDLHGVRPGNVRRHLIEVEDNTRGVRGIGVGQRWSLDPTFDVPLTEALNALCLQSLVHAPQILGRDFVYGEPTHQWSPLRAHVGDREARVHRQAGHARAGEFNCRVQGLIVVVQAAESNNDVFSAHAFGQPAFQHDLNAARNLPPEIPGGPDRGGIGADNRSANGAQRTVHIGVRVGRDYKRSRHDISALNHDLVADARAGRIEIYPVLLREGFNRAVFLQIGFVVILYVVVQGENELPWNTYLLRADRLELAHDSRRVVVRHYVKWPDGNEIAGAPRSLGTIGEVGLSNLFDNCLGHSETPVGPREAVRAGRRTVKRAQFCDASAFSHAAWLGF